MAVVSTEPVQSNPTNADEDSSKASAPCPSASKKIASSPSTVSQASHEDEQTPSHTPDHDDGNECYADDDKEYDLGHTTPKNEDDDDNDEDDEEEDEDEDAVCDEDWKGSPWSPDEVSFNARRWSFFGIPKSSRTFVFFVLIITSISSYIRTKS
jgi:hypothetical protein